jgi:hypothetical protein
MDVLPLLKKLVASRCHFRHQAPHIGLLDSDHRDQFGIAARAGKIDLCLSWTGDMDVSRFMILGVNDEPEPVRSVNDNHGSI